MSQTTKELGSGIMVRNSKAKNACMNSVKIQNSFRLSEFDLQPFPKMLPAKFDPGRTVSFIFPTRKKPCAMHSVCSTLAHASMHAALAGQSEGTARGSVKEKRNAN